MEQIEELEDLCEGILNRIGARSSALLNQGKTLFGIKKDIPPSVKRGSKLHEVGINAATKYLITSCRNKIEESRQKIKNLMEDGLRKRRISASAKTTYEQKLEKIENIIKAIDSIVS